MYQHSTERQVYNVLQNSGSSFYYDSVVVERVHCTAGNCQHPVVLRTRCQAYNVTDPGWPNEQGRVNGQASLVTITINNTKMHHVNLSPEPYLEVTRWERMPGYFP